MFRRASSFVRPNESEKANRAQAKRIAAEESELQKQQRLAARRDKICSAAHNTLPRQDRIYLPDTPLLGPFSPRTEKSEILLVVEPTGETPFKGAKRTNPLREKREQEKEDEKLQIEAVSDLYGVNHSDAKVLLAKNPTLKRPAMRRMRTSEGEMSFGGSYSSSNSISSAPSSPLARTASYSTDKARSTRSNALSRTSSYATDKTSSARANPSSPRAPASPRIVPDQSRPRPVYRTVTEGRSELVQHSPVVRAQRPVLYHVASSMSTTSVDTALIRPMASLSTSSTQNVPTRRSMPPQSPSGSLYSDPLASPSIYASSMYSFAMNPQACETPSTERTFSFGEVATPRTLASSRFHMQRGAQPDEDDDDDEGDEASGRQREASKAEEASAEQSASPNRVMNESDLFDLAASVY